MIESVGFGKIIINGKQYTSDVIIYPDGDIEDNWRRRAGHVLALEDIEKLIAAGPEVIVAGSGVFGRMKPVDELADRLDQQGITLICESNKAAAKTFNHLISERKIGACFHLTC